MSRRTVVLGMVSLMLAALSVWFYLAAEKVPGEPLYTNKILLTTLSLGNLLLLGLVGVVLGRDLYKLFLARRQESGRFRNRLSLSFLAVGVLPNLFLFLGTVLIIQTSVDQWFVEPIEDITTRAPRVKDAALEEAKKYNHLQADRLARAIQGLTADVGTDEYVDRFTQEIVNAVAHDEVDRGFLVDAKGKLIADLALESDAPEPDPVFCEHLFADGLIRGWIAGEGGGRYVRSGVVLRGGEVALVVDTKLSYSLSLEAERLAQSADEYRALRGQRKWIKLFFISSFSLLALLVFFGSLWMGKTVAREITVPIQLLVEGTQRMAQGDEDVQVEYQGLDEIGGLVMSFNAMASELTRSRKELETANVGLDQARHTADSRRAQLETLLQNLTAGVIALRADRTVRWVNRAAQRVLEEDSGDSRGRNGLDLFPQSCQEEVDDLISDAEAGRVVSREVTLEIGSGRKTVRMTVAPIPADDDKGGGVLVSFDDVTTLLKAQRLAAWQEVARRMAHDIKNPLTPIQLSAQRMRKKAADSAPELGGVVQEGTRTIEEEVRVLKSLVDEFSRFARLPRLALREESLKGLLSSVADLYNGSYPGLQVEVNWDLPWESCLFDPEQLRRALVNLMDNAVSANGGTGRVILSGRPYEGETEFLLEVIDDGPGVPREEIHKLFQPYYSTRKKGTGLGLAIVSRIIEEHGGSCSALANQPRGFIVRMCLPYQLVEDPGDSAKTSQPDRVQA